MGTRLSCAQGHEWDAADSHGDDPGTDTAPVCPVCGAVACAERPMTARSAEPATVFLDPARLSGSADSRLEWIAPESEAGSERLQVAGYEILGELGRGGMGVVYKARQLGLNRLVALKMVLAGVHAGREELIRFRAEAEAVARLQHPNIVQVYEVGEHDGRPYCSFEYIDGGSLAQHMNGTPQPAREAARLIETVARAVHFAHQHGIVHRDLKPANILLQKREGRGPKAEQASDSPSSGQPLLSDFSPKITDFGLAKQMHADAGHTRTGTVMGTPSYIAPEQAAGRSKEIGPAADIYSLGAILYEMLTGRPPFRGQNSLDTMMQAMSEEPVAPLRLHSKVPRDLDTICVKCLQKEPRKRYPSAEALADDLRRFLDGELIQARPIGPLERMWKWARRRPAVAALSLLLLLVTVAGFLGVVWEWRQARAAQRQAEIALERSRSNLYFNRIALAEREWQANHVAQAEQILDLCQPDLRHWEWYYLKRLCNADLLSLKGHAGLVRGVAFSPDGRRLASASSDRTVRLWDAASGQALATLVGHQAKVGQVVFSPDGQRLASASEDRTVKLWDLSSGQLLRTFQPHPAEVVALAFSVDGKHLTAVSGTWRERNREEVKVWDTASGQEVRSLRGVGLCVGLSHDGRRLASVSWSPGATELQIWDLTSGQKLVTLPRHLGTGGFVAFSPDGQRLALPSEQQVKIWDLSTNQAMVLCGHTDWITSLVFSADGRRLASAGRDGTAKIWNAYDGRELLTLRGYPTEVARMAFSPDGRRLAAAGDARHVTIWDASTGQEAHTIREGFRTVAFSPDSRLLASAGGEYTIKLWEAASGRELRTFDGHREFIYSIAFRPDGQRLASASRDQTVRLWDVASGKELMTLSGHEAWVTGVVFSPDGRYLASASEDRTVRIWDASTGSVVHILKGHLGGVTCVAYSPDGRRLASASEDGTAKVWDAASGKELATLSGHKDFVYAVAFSPSGRRLATASRDRTVKLWDPVSGREHASLHGHGNSVVSVAFSPDGQRLASGSWDKSVKIWNPATGQEVLTLRGHSGFVTSVAFSPDLQRLASASDEQLKIWEAPQPPPPET